MSHSLYVSGILGTYNTDNEDYLYRKVSSQEGSGKYMTYMVRIKKGPLSEKIQNVASGSVIGLYGCKLGEPYVTKPFVPKGQTEAIRVSYNHIVSIEDIICPDMQSQSAKVQNFSAAQAEDAERMLG
jgi:sporulation protein YlmC with PRC-barrel domain